LTQLDKLCENGVYKTRSEAITDAVRHLLERYAFENEIGMLTSRYLSKKLEKGRELKELTVLTEEEWDEAKKALMSNFGTADVDELLRRLRGGM
jgi:metal-responsive CopG/Arc/MetJ family transcriptional regulator